MYYPYFRGKQFELLTIRENAKLMSDVGFVPIVEPVRAEMKKLQRAIRDVLAVKGKIIVIINPYHGDHSQDGSEIEKLLEEDFHDEDGVIIGILLNQTTSVDRVIELAEKYGDREISIIHAGFASPKTLAARLGDESASMTHVFFEKHCGKSYRQHFAGANRVLIRDGFERQNNADYAELEIFSDLHTNFSTEGFQGFGDFLTVGDAYSDGGGPAYAVAIHITFIDDQEDDVMYVYHFVSTTNGTPTDTAGKFGEALAKLVKAANKKDTKILNSEAIKVFKQLHADAHFPNLGFVKKLSMNHHIETLADYFNN